jgi:putative hydrolase of the HAD superfamily
MTAGGGHPSRRRRTRPTALLIGFDGIVRTFDPAWNVEVELRYGLPVGTLQDVAFDPRRAHRAVTGELSHAEWMADVASVVGSKAAVEDWQTYRGDIDFDVINVVRDVRAAGYPVGLGTDATDRLDEDLGLLGVADEFDVVVNASAVGFAKPHPAFFAAACDALSRPAHEVLFLDDAPRYVAGARAAGLNALRYAGHADLAYVRTTFGL